LNTKNYSLEKADYGETYDAKALGSTIRFLRERLQMTQNELGDRSSFSTAEISKLENGSRKKVPLDSLIRIAPHLNVSLDYLLASCITNSKNDYERFYDFEGNEIDLFKIAKNLYSVDSTLLLLLSSPDFLSDKESIKLMIAWIELKSTVDSITDKSSTPKKIFNDFKKYCFNFIDTLSHSFKEKSSNTDNGICLTNTNH